MLGRERSASCLVVFLLLTVSFAQNRYVPQQRHDQDGRWHKFQKQNQNENRFNSRPNGVHPPQNQPGHAGNWLRHYKDLPPAQQRRALESDPQFRRLSPQRQAQLQKKLQHFSNLPPQQQERVLNRMETWEHLTQDQKHQARQVFQQFKQLPPDRRQAVNRSIRSMRGLTLEQRDQLINSDQVRSAFSPQERSILRGASHLPLAPGDGLQPPPEE
jgi:hypothetical protein